MSAVLIPNGKQSYIDAAGNPLVGGKLYTYAAGTNTPQATWQDAGQIAANTNPVVMDGRGEATIFWLGAYKIVLKDALNNTIWTLDNVSASEFVKASDLAGSNGSALVGYSATAAYAAGTLGKHAQTVVSVTDAPFNAKCDGITDDTAAVQAALDFCSGVAVNRVLRIPGKCYITAPLIVNRLVETTTGEFLIIGDGPQGGFYTDQAIKIFSTTIANGTDPQSEGIKFQNVRFEASNAALAAYCFSQDFLRLKFVSCYFRKIKVVSSTIYLQDWKFLHCNFRYWAGTTFAAGDGQKQVFGCVWTNCTWEFGEAGFRGVPVGCAFVGNLFEGSTQFIWQAGCAGLTITGNYTEGNTLPDYVFTDIPNGGAARGIFFAGNFMQVSTLAFYNIGLGDVRGMVSQGNTCNGNMFNMASTRFGRLISINDYCSANKWSPPLAGNGPYARREVYALGSGDYTPGVVAKPGGGRAGAPLISTYLTIVATCATANDSIVLPASDDMTSPDFSTDELGQPTRSVFRDFFVKNDGVANLAVITAQSDFTNYGLNVTLIVAPGTVRRIAQLNAGATPIFLN